MNEEEEFIWCIEQTLFFGEDREPLNMIQTAVATLRIWY